MLIRYVLLALVCFASGIAISGGYFAFISLIGIFPKLLEKVKGARHYIDREPSGVWSNSCKCGVSV